MINTLIVDIGNTKVKAAIFNKDRLVEKIVFAADDLSPLLSLVQNHKPTKGIVSSVATEPLALNTMLGDIDLLTLSAQVKLPFTNSYATPQTLGMDRIAGVAGAVHFFNQKACLVIDMGTCVTYDFITAQGEYLGGAISPGLHMRLHAMHHFTQKLPAVEFEAPQNFIGNTTKSSMLSGAYFGLLGEINDTITRYEEQFGSLEVILCGGDVSVFDKHTKKSIFAAPDLVLHGLHKILEYNAN